MPGPIFVHSSTLGANQLPINTVVPTIAGTAAVGSTLTSASGTWIHNPTSYTIQWQQNGSTNINGANTNSYLPVSADSGKTLNVVYKAFNLYGNTSASSAPTAVVTGGGTTPSPPSGSPYTNLVYFNDFTTSASINDFTKANEGDFGNHIGESIAGGILHSQLTPSAISWDGTSNLIITTSAAGGGAYNAGLCSSVNTARTAGNVSAIPGYSGTVLAWTHGTFLARINFPGVAGKWDAWWSLPTNAGFTAAQEMDWIETLPGTNGNASNNVYWATGHGGAGSSMSTGVSFTFPNVYATYGGTIDASGNGTWWLNGNSVKTLAQGSNWVGRQWFLILGTAVGGWNQGSIDTTGFPNIMYVDWVAVWQ